MKDDGANSIERMRQKDRIESLIRKAIHYVEDTVNNDFNAEKLQFECASLEKERIHIHNWESTSIYPVHDLAYKLTERIEMTMTWLVEREKNRKAITAITKECAQRPNAVISSYEDEMVDYDKEEFDSEADHCRGDSEEEDDDDEDVKAGRKLDKTRREIQRQKDRERSSAKVPCKICGKIYSQSYIQNHQRMHLPDDIEKRKPFECDECGLRCATNSILNGHKRSHQPEKDKMDTCDICGKQFIYWRLNKHRRTHFTSGDFECKICGKYFADNKSFAIHRKAHERRNEKEDRGTCSDDEDSEDWNDDSDKEAEEVRPSASK